MNTITHFLVNAGIDRGVRDVRGADANPIATKPFLWGSVAPDLPLILLTAGAFVWFPLARGWSVRQTFEHVFRDLFFDHRAFIAVNQSLQAPPLLLAGLAAGLALRRWRPALGRAVTWFYVGSMVHVATDILVHHDDGPLLLFPFDWETRFHSPVSYWDPRHHGDVFEIFEYALIGTLAGYLLWPALHRALRRRRDDGPEGPA